MPQITANTAHFGMRLEADFKEESFRKVKELGTTPADLFRDVLEYVVRNNRLPIRKEVLNDDDAVLLDLVKNRLKNPGEIMRNVNLDDLLAGHPGRRKG